jgi:hypothetical protein
VKGGIEDLRFFKDNERSYNFFIYILKKYLSEEIISYCDNIDNLVQLAEVLYNLLLKKRSLIKCFTRVIERIISLEQTERSEKFLLYIINKSDEMKLNLSLIEKVYLGQKSWLIEKPLADFFIAYCSDNNKEEHLNNMSLLLENVVYSPLLFQTISNQLIEFFVETKYSQIAQDFIRGILDKIEINCNKCRKDILELYPTHLQFLVILLRIKQNAHSENSKNQTVQSLKEIFLNDFNDATVLVSHFPEWLPEYLEFFET